jgi:CRISPR/Cas system CMR subunit Cmr4 (Cas7 group RAMP superfamily)
VYGFRLPIKTSNQGNGNHRKQRPRADNEELVCAQGALFSSERLPHIFTDYTDVVVVDLIMSVTTEQIHGKFTVAKYRSLN